MKNVNVEIIKVGSLETNCYFLENNNQVIVIDPGDDYYILKRYLMDKKVIAILITHNHEDHVGALDSMARETGAPVYKKSNLKEGKYEFGPFHFEVIYTPGHTSDSISYYFYEYNLLFSGDFLFKHTVGRMDLDTGSVEDMKHSLSRIYEYSDRMKIYPGHGESTTLGEEKRENQYFHWVQR